MAEESPTDPTTKIYPCTSRQSTILMLWLLLSPGSRTYRLFAFLRSWFHLSDLEPNFAASWLTVVVHVAGEPGRSKTWRAAPLLDGKSRLIHRRHLNVTSILALESRKVLLKRNSPSRIIVCLLLFVSSTPMYGFWCLLMTWTVWALQQGPELSLSCCMRFVLRSRSRIKAPIFYIKIGTFDVILREIFDGCTDDSDIQARKVIQPARD